MSETKTASGWADAEGLNAEMSERNALEDGTIEPASADFSEVIDAFQQAVEGLPAQLARTLARPLLPGGYDVVRYSSAVATGVADGSGAVTLAFPDVQPGFMWFVDRIGLTCSTGSWSSVQCFVGSAALRRLVDVSIAGPADISDQHSPVVVGSGFPLTAVAAGMTSGAELTAHVQYRLAVAL